MRAEQSGGPFFRQATYGSIRLAAQKAKFDVGEIVVTPTASAALEAVGQTIEDLVDRHQAGDWGEVSEQVRAVNERGLAEQFNLQSVYATPTGQRLVVITTSDRSLTMIHLAPQMD
jgi:hypothetical protein